MTRQEILDFFGVGEGWRTYIMPPGFSPSDACAYCTADSYCSSSGSIVVLATQGECSVGEEVL